MEVNLQIIGSIFDASGIVVLVALALIGTVRQMAAQSGAYWDTIIEPFRSISASYVDTAVGASMLFLGFLLQTAGPFGFGVSVAMFMGLCVLSDRPYIR
ncbi:MAG: hypothetical protein OXH83_19625 [Bryobacterales bacterium]|nr:hypothetical protein [Bryobacterales bacterium]